MSGTERSEFKDTNWHKREDRDHRRQWQKSYRRAVRLAVVAEDWDGDASRRWRRTSGWLSH